MPESTDPRRLTHEVVLIEGEEDLTVRPGRGVHPSGPDSNRAGEEPRAEGLYAIDVAIAGEEDFTVRPARSPRDARASSAPAER